MALAVLTACNFDPKLPGGIDINCGANGECPDGWECTASTNRCRQIGSDSPGVTSVDVSPAIGKKGTVFTVRLVTNKLLARPPVLSPLGFEYSEADSDAASLTWVFHYTATGDEKEGPYRLVGELKDNAGNVASVPVGVLNLDFTPPLPIAGSMKVVPGVARPTQTVLLQVDFDEVLGAGAALAQPRLNIAGLPSTVKNTNTLAFRFTVPPTADSGEYGFTISHITDLAGNEAADITAESPLSVESQLTVDSDAPVLEAIALNRENFSRTPGFDELVLTFRAGSDAVAVAAFLESTPLTCATVGMTATETLWRCTHTVDANDTEGVKTLRTTAVDLAGNTSAETRPVTLDFTPPAVVAGSMRITPGVATVGETVVAQLNFNEILAPGAQLQQSSLQVVNLASAVANNVAVAFTFTVPIGVSDGDYAFAMTGVRDLAGNVASVGTLERSLTIDSTPPVISNLQFNAANRRYSRVTGFNEVVVTFTVSEPNALTAARIGAELMTCTAPTTSTRRCALTVGPSAVEGLAAVQLEVRDAVGNGSSRNEVVTFDFTPPRVAQGTLQKTLVPPADSLLPQVTALAAGAHAVITFSLTETVSGTPVLKLDGRAFTCTADALSYSCDYEHLCAALGDGPHSLDLAMTDEVGNAFSGNPSATLTLTTDCTPPPAPDTASETAVVWHRAPYGASWASNRVGSRLELAGDALSEAVALVRVGVEVSPGVLAPLASAAFTPGTPVQIPVLDQLDRLRVSVQSIDGAGNASRPASVLNVNTSVALFSPDATSQAPGLFRIDSADDVLRNAPADQWATATQTTTRLKATALLSTDDSYVQAMAPLPNGKALMFGAPGCLVYDGALNRWVKVTGTIPLVRWNETLVPLPDGQVLMFGGHLASSNALATDSWLFTAATQTWAQLAGAQPPAREQHQLVRLGARKALLFGGTRGGLPFSDTWVFDVDTLAWRQITGTHPVGRTNHLMATLGSGNVVLYGGTDSVTGNVTDTWVFDADREVWVQDTGTAPPDQSGRVMVSLTDGTVLMFGGPNGPAPQQNTWVYTEGSGWALAPVASEPPLVSSHQMVALTDGRAVLFGGEGQGGFTAMTWVYDAKVPEWRQAPIGPGPRYTHSMVALGSNRAVMFGSKNITDSVWVFDGASETWSIALDDVPPASYGSAAPLATNRMLLTGQYLDDRTPTPTWVFSGETLRWQKVDTGSIGMQRTPGLVRLTSGDVLLHNGYDSRSWPVNETWRYSAANDRWSQVQGAQPVIHCCSTYVPLANDEVLQVGGSNFTDGLPLRISWRFSGNDWQQIPGAQPRGGATNPLAVLGDGRVLAFGGYSLGYNGESWVFSPSTNGWVQTTGAAPDARQQHVMAPFSNNRVLMFGGEGFSGWLDTPWVFDGATNTWSQLQTPGPLGVFSGSLRAIADDRLILFGGINRNGQVGELWAFDGATQTWALLDGPNHGARSDSMSATLDDQRLVVFGGSNSSGGSRDTWVYETRGGAMAGQGFIALKTLGLSPLDVTSVAAHATAGADGYDPDGKSAPGAALQLLMSAVDGPVFTSCDSTQADSASPVALDCRPVAFTAGTHVALRVAPNGASNARPVNVTIASAELEVRARLK